MDKDFKGVAFIISALVLLIALSIAGAMYETYQTANSCNVCLQHHTPNQCFVICKGD